MTEAGASVCLTRATVLITESTNCLKKFVIMYKVKNTLVFMLVLEWLLLNPEFHFFQPSVKQVVIQFMELVVFLENARKSFFC